VLTLDVARAVAAAAEAEAIKRRATVVIAVVDDGGQGDVLIVPNGTPHWFQEVSGPLNYYVVKVR
jgi:uncharacterized protein GlcG (DUF336 family)